MQLLRNLTETELKGKRVLLRADLNVPFQNGVPLDDFRVKRILPTIAFLLEKGAKVRIISHHSTTAQSLKPLVGILKHITPVVFGGTATSAELDGEERVVLYENLRFDSGEEKNDEVFAKMIASRGDLYVNDAFSASHRAHASIISLPKFLPHYAGFLFEDEIRHLGAAFNPPHPFLFILGGGKADKKIPLIRCFMGHADTIFIGGAVAVTFFKKHGWEVGRSLVADTESVTDALIYNEKIILPQEVVVKNNKGDAQNKKPEDVAAEDTILDIGPRAIKTLKQHISRAAFILWNGPVGDYLVPGFGKGSKEMASLIAESAATTVVGGGDTVALISEAGLQGKFTFVSTGGGAMLEFLADRTLPGIEALR